MNEIEIELTKHLARVKALADGCPPSFELTWASWLESVSPKAREEIAVASRRAEELETVVPRLVAALEHSMQTAAMAVIRPMSAGDLQLRERETAAILRGEEG